MQFIRKHRDRTRSHLLAEGQIETSVVGWKEQVCIVLYNEESQYRLDLTPHEARELANRLLSLQSLQVLSPVPSMSLSDAVTLLASHDIEVRGLTTGDEAVFVYQDGRCIVYNREGVIRLAQTFQDTSIVPA